MAKTLLPDETNEHDILVYLKVALDAESKWTDLCAELRKTDSPASFLGHVVCRVPFYRERIALSGLDPLDLTSFPVALRAHYNNSPEDFLAAPPEQHDARLFALTNGTIAPELKVQFDPAGWYEFNYGTYHTVASVIPGLVSRMAPGEEGVFLVTNALYQPRMSVYIPPLNAAILRQLIIGRAEQEDRLCVAYLRDRPGHLLYGKPSNLISLAAIDSKLPNQTGHIRPFAILVSGESLYEDQRERLEDWFQCSVFNAYIATEGGLIAMECPYRTGLHIRDDFVQVEVLDHAGVIRDRGRGDILITNLFNRAHVFVRYQLGDQVEVAFKDCSCGFVGPSIVKLIGREAESFMTSAGEIPAESFAGFLAGLPLREFQVFQSGLEPLILKWVSEDCDPAAIGRVNRTIQEWLYERGLEKLIITAPLSSITPRGGKQRRFIRKPA
jgi:hypothetical protein